MEDSAKIGTGGKIMRNWDLKYKLQGEIYLLEGVRLGMGCRYGIKNRMAFENKISAWRVLGHFYRSF